MTPNSYDAYADPATQAQQVALAVAAANLGILVDTSNPAAAQAAINTAKQNLLNEAAAVGVQVKNTDDTTAIAGATYLATAASGQMIPPQTAAALYVTPQGSPVVTSGPYTTQLARTESAPQQLANVLAVSPGAIVLPPHAAAALPASQVANAQGQLVPAGGVPPVVAPVAKPSTAPGTGVSSTTTATTTAAGSGAPAPAPQDNTWLWIAAAAALYFLFGE